MENSIQLLANSIEKLANAIANKDNYQQPLPIETPINTTGIPKTRAKKTKDEVVETVAEAVAEVVETLVAEVVEEATEEISADAFTEALTDFMGYINSVIPDREEARDKVVELMGYGKKSDVPASEYGAIMTRMSAYKKGAK